VVDEPYRTADFGRAAGDVALIPKLFNGIVTIVDLMSSGIGGDDGCDCAGILRSPDRASCTDRFLNNLDIEVAS
jgi:hypothetical protein